MNNKQNDDLTTHVESRLLQKIGDLEAVKLNLEEDIRNSSGTEREKNQNLLIAATDLLVQLKQAQVNIHSLIEKSL